MATRNATSAVDATDVTTSFAANHGHVPVMRTRMGDLLEPAVERYGETAILIDGTLGAGGHSESFLQRFPQAKVIGVDRDIHALEATRQRLAPFGERFLGIHCRFDAFDVTLQELASQTDAHPVAQLYVAVGVTGALFDLGVSSMQLDEESRGFAYRFDAPLDMRMDDSQVLTAADILNTYSQQDIARILKVYGEERFAGKIAAAIVREREQRPFETSAQLVELLYASIPAAARRTGGHPAKRTFQALRVEVNKELEAIEQVLPAITQALRPGGRAVFMSYQSLEDKIVKRYFREITESKTPPGLPMELPEYAPEFELITRGAEQASKAEQAENPRAASVRVRAVAALDKNEIDGARIRNDLGGG
ncbi:MAG: 16S rRNA (cytosine(1402)-N(4))-methyltransferase RsmH [Corynebacterium sp.]|nr:16S rRNA (cytosine(1402)-N(4))-methyltransferase RsmH [Corynebacterium sp.]